MTVRRPSPVVRAALLVAAVVAAGFALGLYAGRRPASDDRGSPPVQQVLRAGDVRVTMSRDWKRTSAAARPIPGLDVARAQTLAAPYSRVVVAQSAPGGPSLLPARLLRALGGAPPPPTVVRSGRLSAWRYALTLGRGPGRQADVDAIPTTDGVVLVACVGPIGEVRQMDCDAALRTVHIEGARPLPVGPEAGFLSGLRRVVARLSAARRAGRERLAAATDPAARVRAAGQIATAYDAAAGRLGRLVARAGDGRRTVALLRRLRDEHVGLANAAALGDSLGATFAVGLIRADEKALEAQLARRRDEMAAA